MQQNNQAECKYSLHGYLLVFQYWIYEAFPKIGRHFGHRIRTSLKCPRMHKWQPQMVLAENVIKEFLATEENQLTNWKSHMESIVASVQHDLPPPTNQAEFEMLSTSEHVEDVERSTKEKKR
ncbi:uncharacterized protein LOC111402701 [Olea europaea var. sylvestris]|uniref:uncharacterized protein LOC111402701 n=1 Tax=Olea europaea var. sylvestris TaxID=158386 RepID=UPI000C1D5B6C|nr:uncharacterized protein LOC111402701 [Olea europaea var. sylvestris]